VKDKDSWSDIPEDQLKRMAKEIADDIDASIIRDFIVRREFWMTDKDVASTYSFMMNGDWPLNNRLRYEDSDD